MAQQNMKIILKNTYTRMLLEDIESMEFSVEIIQKNNTEPFELKVILL
jgi:hypothetical protein